MPLMIERFCSGGLPRPRFSGSIGSKSFKTRHSASVRSPRLKPASKSSLESILSDHVNLVIAASRMPHHNAPMPAWSALLLMVISGTITVLSFRANKEAARTGRLRFLFWHIPGWGERDRSLTFFKFAQAQNHYRTAFFGFLTFILGAFLLEALGVIY
jgi:hypothetical protein